MSQPSSARESAMLSGRAPASRGSLVVVAVMLATLGIVLSKSIIPAYHEHQSLLKRAGSLEERVEEQKVQAERLQSEIDAYSDPYYLVSILLTKYNFVWDKKSETWRERHGIVTPQASVENR